MIYHYTSSGAAIIADKNIKCMTKRRLFKSVAGAGKGRLLPPHVNFSKHQFLDPIVAMNYRMTKLDRFGIGAVGILYRFGVDEALACDFEAFVEAVRAIKPMPDEYWLPFIQDAYYEGSLIYDNWMFAMRDIPQNEWLTVEKLVALPHATPCENEEDTLAEYHKCWEPV